MSAVGASASVTPSADTVEPSESVVSQSFELKGLSAAGVRGTESVEGAEVIPIVGAAAVITCVGSVGLSTYQAFKGGDPFEYIAGAIIGCVSFGTPLGAALRPAVVGALKASKPALIWSLKKMGLAANSALILALGGS